MQTITREQLAGAHFRHATGEISVRETHLSMVVLTGEYAYKVKKAVKLDFIDTRSLQRRRELCEEELRLNQRLAPELYLHVVPIVRDAGGLRFEETGTPIEYAVQMRQFDSNEELQTLLRSHAVHDRDFFGLADCIAAFHRIATVLREPTLSGTAAFVRNARENLASVAGRSGRIGASIEVSELQGWTEDRLSRELPHLENRERQGFVRECHGDLHTGNVMRWRGRLLPFDCIEFDPELRFIDVLNDIAFLVMDLVAKDRRDLAFAFLNRYLERTGDYLGIRLLPCYTVYRALVRMKIALINLQQDPEIPGSREQANIFLQTALSFSQEVKPTLVLMHGPSGSGKSWLSEQLVPSMPALRIRSDLERKRLAGRAPFAQFAKADPEIYTLEFNVRTYAHLLECARECLRAGINAIVDAAFLKAHERQAFAALANSEGAGFLILSCTADTATLAVRIEQRRASRNDPSDADEQVMRRQIQTMESIATEELPHVLEMDTRDPNALQRTLERIRQVTAAAAPRG